jgi:hypothetical protein
VRKPGVLARRAVAFALALGSVVMLPSTAPSAYAQASNWVAMAPQSPVGLAANELTGVSCWAPNGCFAVGYSATTPGQPALVERLGAGGWALPNLPPGPGSYRNHLDAISCASASFCVAVGFYQNYARPTEPLIETYSNGSWSVSAGSGPGAGGNFLTGVSCPAVGSCYAVGYYSNELTDQLFAETLAGGAWSPATAASAGSGPQLFEGVSCPAVGDCWAVGYYQASPGSPQQALAEYLSGGSWALGQAADAAPGSNRLAGVSCAALGSCVAVGTYFNGHAFQTLAESLAGTTWSVAQSPNASVANNGLQAVSCPPGGGCEAVGEFSNGREEQTLAMYSSGGAWHLQTSPNEADSSNDLSGVACPVSGTCEAVGSFVTGGNSEVLSMALSGTAWSVVPAQGQQAPFASLVGVSCPEPGNCVAVGSGASSAGPPQVLAEVYTAGTWATSVPAVPPGAVASYFQAVSCPALGSCMAVGYYLSPGGAPQALAESYSSGSWQLLAVPLPSTAGSYLQGVSCPTAGSCVAVGYDLGAGGAPQLLVETYSASLWSLAAAPLPVGAQASYLSGVSCPAVARCVAVGWYSSAGRAQTLVEALSGGAWFVTASADEGNGANALEAVSCPPAGACTAVGYYSVNGNDHPLAETVVAPGAGATLGSLPAGVGVLAGVSCPSAATCVAVGNRTNGLAHQSLVAAGAGGAWSVLRSYDSSGVANNTLAAVSCPTSSFCVAVGSYQSGSATLALAEQGQAGSSQPASSSTTTTSQPAATSTTRPQGPRAAGTATLLASRPDPSLVGRRVTYIAVVRPLPRGGTVTFTDDGVGIPACRDVPLSRKGLATCSVVYSSPGDHVVEALYSGSAGYSSSASGPYSQVVAAPPPLAQGYWLATKRGAVFAAGAARKLLGLSVAGSNPVVAIAAAPDGNGYWVAAANGKVGAFGSARFYGDLPHLKVHVDDIVGITPTPDGRGYWLVGRDGGLFAFGDAPYEGSLVSLHLHLKDIVGMIAMPGAKGYALASRTGAVFTFGDAHFYGSLPAQKRRVDDITALVGFGARGYMLVGAGGGVFTFGPGAHFYGSLPAAHVRVSDIVGAALTPDGRGYLLAGANGAVYGFGDAVVRPVPPGLLSRLPVVGIAGR